MTAHTMRRADRARTEAFARRLAADAPYGMLVTASKDGVPYAVPVSPAIEGNAIYFHGARNVGRKLENIDANAHVSMVFVGPTEVDEPGFSVNYSSAIFEGRAVRLTDETERMHGFWVIASRWCPSQGPNVRADYMKAFAAGADVWRIDIENVSAKARGVEEDIG